MAWDWPSAEILREKLERNLLDISRIEERDCSNQPWNNTVGGWPIKAWAFEARARSGLDTEQSVIVLDLC